IVPVLQVEHEGPEIGVEDVAASAPNEDDLKIAGPHEMPGALILVGEDNLHKLALESRNVPGVRARFAEPREQDLGRRDPSAVACLDDARDGDVIRTSEKDVKPLIRLIVALNVRIGLERDLPGAGGHFEGEPDHAFAAQDAVVLAPSARRK